MMVNTSHGPHATPNLRHLMLFDQVVRRGSVSAAARASHLSQPAVTQAVGQIEAAFGARLMQRSYSGLALTGEGRADAQRVERALAMLRDALVAVRARAGNAASADVLRGITTTQLHALIAVVEEGAFARAARRAGRARAAVHRAARQLERSLGTDLFEVTSFGVRPTREAARLALRTRLAFAEIAQAQAEVAAAQGTGSGSTVIGAMPLARSVLVPRAVLEFAALRPEHAISILDGPYESMLAALRRGSADVLIGALRDPIPFDDIKQEHLFDDPLAIVVGSRHPLVGRGAPTLAALSRFPWIAPRRAGGRPAAHALRASADGRARRRAPAGWRARACGGAARPPRPVAGGCPGCARAPRGAAPGGPDRTRYLSERMRQGDQLPRFE